jgi:hypothetical protein
LSRTGFSSAAAGIAIKAIMIAMEIDRMVPFLMAQRSKFRFAKPLSASGFIPPVARIYMLEGGDRSRALIGGIRNQLYLL